MDRTVGEERLTQAETRFAAAVSRSELERRWAQCRDLMRRQGLDALVALADNDHLGGTVKWLSDVSAFLYPKAVVLFPDGMTIVDHGPLGGGRSLDGERPDYPGADELRTTAEFASVCYTRAYTARLVADALEARHCRRVGFAGLLSLPHGFVLTLQERLPKDAMLDVTEDFDALKAMKSGEERKLLREAAQIQDLVFERVLAAVAPGMRQSDVVALARYESSKFGSEQGVFLCRSAPLGSPTPVARGPHFDHRVLQQGDYFSLLIENNAPSGFYSELGRTIVLGRASESLRTAFDLAVSAQAQIASSLVAGASCRAVYESHAAFMKGMGQSAGRRITAHGQGYDLVERPLVREDETMAVADGMLFAIHPGANVGGDTAFVCDNFLVGTDGGWMHRTPKKIFEI
ncbi:MAG: hypothetical protein JWO64_3438 [Hyphomicrobiales bacterium]|jgi:Xaa-Pro aminopeptidase|nr:hypothetical protein [Hyphomicrobiales bacterium]